MLRHNNAIRLSSVDQSLLEALTGQKLPPPKTVAEYNQRLQLAAQTWHNGRTRDERFLGVIATGLLLDEDDCASVIDQGKLVPRWH